jgi:putative transcriptional regulator
MTVNVAQIRAKTGLSQPAFSTAYGVPLATLRNWEQQRTEPDATHRALFRLISHDHKAIADMLAATNGAAATPT